MPTNFGPHCNGCPYQNASHLSNERYERNLPLSKEKNGGDILLIFQAPGVNEWRLGKPISSMEPGSAGSRLAKAFQRVKKSRSDFDITNIVQCFPGKQDSVTGQSPRDKPPLGSAIKHCSNWLRQDIDLNQHKKVVVFGSVAKKAVCGLGFDYKDDRFKFIRHPAGGLLNIDLDGAID